MTKGAVRLGDDPSAEYCKIIFRRPEAERGANLPMFVRSELLDPIAGLGASRRPEGPDRNAREDIVEHLRSVRVSAQAVLGKAVATMRDVMALEPGDVLLIQKKANEAIELTVQGRAVLSGLPVTCAGRYALLVETGPGG